jgi:hypothetical protein
MIWFGTKVVSILSIVLSFSQSPRRRMESAIVFYFLVYMKELKALGLPTRVMALALVLPSGETIVFYLCRANYATPTESPSELYFILKLR